MARRARGRLAAVKNHAQIFRSAATGKSFPGMPEKCRCDSGYRPACKIGSKRYRGHSTGRMAFLVGALLMIANWPWTLFVITATVQPMRIWWADRKLVSPEPDLEWQFSWFACCWLRMRASA